MKQRFIVSKQANFYYFLHNLAECEWPWPARLENSKAWNKELGSFTKEEQDALKKFKKIYKNYFLKIYLGKPFFLKKNPWKALGRKITRKEIDELQKVFFIWQKKFEKIYKKDLPKLQNWQKKLKLQLKKSDKKSKTKTINRILTNLYKCPAPKNQIKVYLMLSKKPSSRKYASGASGERGRGLDGKSILVELSRCPTQKINYIMGILWHEIIHCHFSPCHVMPLLSKEVKNKKIANRLEEIINRSLFPTGILSMKFFNAPSPSTLSRGFISNINRKQTKKIINFTNQYIQRNKSFDKYYIKELLRILKKSL